MNQAIFSPWARITAIPIEGAEQVGGRLRLKLEFDAAVTDVFPPGGTTPIPPASVAIDLLGPGDVEQLTGRAIARVAPQPGSRDAEGEHCVYVDFAAPDLPWRYSPAPAQGGGMQPWVAVVAGVEGVELGLAGDGRLWMSKTITSDMPPHLSECWAHVHREPDGGPVPFVTSRVLCPRKLPSLSNCLAAIVPLYRSNGEFRWAAGQSAAGLPVLHHWRFRTNDQGTFRDLAQKLYGAAPPPGLGAATVSASPGGDPTATATMFGALAPRTAPDAGGWDQPDVLDRVAPLLGSEPEPDDPPVLAPPGYGTTWLPPALSAPWASQADLDPRHRGAAGLGGLAGIDWQQRIADAAGTRLGSTHQAASLLRDLTVGVALTESLDRRRRPADAPGLVAHYAPALGQVASSVGGTALNRASGPNTPLAPSLFSAAAARLLRPGGGHARAGQDPVGVGSMARLIEAANRCTDPAPSPLPFVSFEGDSSHIDLGPAIGALNSLGYPEMDDEIRHLATTENAVGEIVDPPREGESREYCEPVDLESLGRGLVEAFRPEGAMVQRVAGRIRPVPDRWDVPLEVEPDLDLPAWTWLRDNRPQWLLPGAGLIESDSVIALRSNPTFVDAFLLGLSRQAAAELRWRGVPLAVGAMPMRTFWQGVARSVGTTRADVLPVRMWDPSTDLGDETHVAPGGFGNGLVISIRSDLFARYPDTIVYLAPRIAIAGRGVFVALEDAREPVVTGRVGPDIWFFGFDVPPDSLGGWIVVLEEPLPGPRFGTGTPIPAGYRIMTEVLESGPSGTVVTKKTVDAGDGADYAAKAYLPPVRVLIDGADLS